MRKQVGLEADGLAVILDRALQVAFLVARPAPVVKGFGVVGLEADGLGVEADFLIVVRCVNPSLEPLLCSQFFFGDRRRRRDCCLLLGGGFPRSRGCAGGLRHPALH
jgi:hypothetical protein